MKFVVAPDKYKGSLSGAEFYDAVEHGIKRVFPNATIIKKPLADGGDGTIDVIRDYLKAEEIEVLVRDPLFNLIKAKYLYSEQKKTAFIEMSEASGYRLLTNNDLNCRLTTSLGTGELIADALDKGAEQIILGIGGSATNDGGMGIAVALGYEFLGEKNHILTPIGENLIKVKTISKAKADKRLEKVQLKVACDVNNPFYGPEGAAYVYAPQKGATAEDVNFLDKGLEHFAKALNTEFGVDVQKIPGSGAAGGVGGGSVVFLNATLNSGIDLVKEIADFENAIEQANWIITGEGKLDNQTFSGKTIFGVVESAKKKNIPVAAFCGAIELTLEEQESMGITYASSVLKNVGSFDEAVKSSYENLEFAAFNFARILKRDITLI
ncbi:glycerate kinase [Croceitalea rosinachiae]|uniref:Glycerate kinase n=1 Tax=Croceitalea rosinachiae TaxID=3075596 RepID=A0ABU3A5K6_9FLAO|nr:glycerate kinase [Croceitalea sp. F388]MDT0605456.1 glycerate kinase [Croceitalea sp. F388]